MFRYCIHGKTLHISAQSEITFSFQSLLNQGLELDLLLPPAKAWDLVLQGVVLWPLHHLIPIQLNLSLEINLSNWWQRWDGLCRSIPVGMWGSSECRAGAKACSGLQLNDYVTGPMWVILQEGWPGFRNKEDMKPLYYIERLLYCTWLIYCTDDECVIVHLPRDCMGTEMTCLFSGTMHQIQPLSLCFHCAWSQIDITINLYCL